MKYRIETSHLDHHDPATESTILFPLLNQLRRRV